MNKKEFVFRYYRLFNNLPFNNHIKGTINIHNSGSILRKCHIISTGKNNSIILPHNCYFNRCEFIFLGDNNTIQFGPNCLAKNASFHIEDSNNSIIVGCNTTFCGQAHLAAIEGTRIVIGDDCLFSSDIVFRTGDSHSIIDSEGNRINPSEDIVIKNHVWIGHRVLINKGVLISSNSIIGTGAIVTKKFNEKNVVLVGIPARIAKTNINWDSKRL